MLLARYSGEDDIAIGSPIANRTRPETATLLGFFANTMVLRTDLSGDPTFMEVSGSGPRGRGRRVQPPGRAVRTAGEVAAAGTVARAHVVVPTHVRVPERPGTRPGARRHCRHRGRARTPTPRCSTSPCSCAKSTMVSSAVSSSPPICTTAASAERFVHHFRRISRGASSPIRKRRSSTLELLDDDERRQILVDWNSDRGRAFPPRVCTRSSRNRSAIVPGAIALTAGDVSFTYAELNARANQLAHHLQRLGVGPDVCVGICLPRSIDAVIALLATLKAGGAYMPLDPDYPPARLAFMVADGHVGVVVTRTTSRGDFDASDASLVCLDAEADRQTDRRDADEQSAECGDRSTIWPTSSTRRARPASRRE